jgi:AraC-like DNA-binding protein
MKVQLPKRPLDPLSDSLQLLRMSSTLYSRCYLTSPWGLELPALPGMLMFHVVTVGHCWLSVDDTVLRLLQRGDFVLVPRGSGHSLLSHPGAQTVPLFDMPREYLSERYEIIRHAGGGAPTEIVCGTMEVDNPGAVQLLTLLPPVIGSEVMNPVHKDWLLSTLQLMAEEAVDSKAGRETLLSRLADVVVMHAIRSWIENDPAASTGWLQALRDKQIGRAIALIHDDPSRPWTLASLAEEVAMSRSAFATRFAELVGTPVMQYVTQWRMQVAMSLLKSDGTRVGDLAARLGYQSEAAFSRAFKRYTGFSPSAVKRSPSLPALKPAVECTREAESDE